jgi:HEAT repeat protein
VVEAELFRQCRNVGIDDGNIGVINVVGGDTDLEVAIPGLAELLRDEDFMVRMWAAHALGSIGPTAALAVPALEAALDDEDSR